MYYVDPERLHGQYLRTGLGPFHHYACSVQERRLKTLFIVTMSFAR